MIFCALVEAGAQRVGQLPACALLAACVLAGCAPPLVAAVRPPTLSDRAAARTAAAELGAEVVPLTQALVRARPVNPPGTEAEVVRLIAERLEADGIEVDVVEVQPGRPNLLARVRGQTARAGAVVLEGHADVVTARPEDWDPRGPPFEANLVGAELRGRGVLDMLGTIAVQTLTLVALARLPQPPRRDVLQLVVVDEEVAGQGIEAAFARWPELAEAMVALGEGGVVLENGADTGRDLIALSVAEKGVFWFDLVTRGEPGHGSRPSPVDAPHRLHRAVGRVLARPQPFVLTTPAERMLAHVGEARGGLEGVVLQRPLLLGLLGQGSLEEDPETNALVHDTCALTVLDAGSQQNVVPAEARASFDCRLLPGTDPATFRDQMLLAVDDSRVELEVKQASPANGSEPDGRVVGVIKSVLEGELEGAQLVPLLTRGATDNRAFRARGVPAYGLIPIRVDDDELSSMHGKNERVRVAELEAALPRMLSLVRALAELPDEPEDAASAP